MNFTTGIGLSNRVYAAGSMPSYLGYAGGAVSGTGAVPGDVQVAGRTFNPAGTGYWPVRSGYLGIMPLRVRGFKAMALDTIGLIPADDLPLTTSVNVRMGRTDGVGEASFFSGWGGLWNVMTGKEQARGAALNEQIAAQNAAAVAAGIMTQAQADAAARSLDNPSDYRDEIYDAFAKGAAEGLAAEQKLFKDTTTGILGGALGFIPWWAWVGGAVVLANYLGVFKGLKGSLSPAARARRKYRSARRAAAI